MFTQRFIAGLTIGSCFTLAIAILHSGYWSKTEVKLVDLDAQMGAGLHPQMLQLEQKAEEFYALMQLQSL